MIYIAWLIKKEEPDKSIIFKQKRVGKDGKIFVCYKFRTMYQNSDEILQDYLSKNLKKKSIINSIINIRKTQELQKLEFLRKVL